MKDTRHISAEVRVLGVSDDEEEVTGITDLYHQPAETSPAVYRLDGTRVNASSPLRPSIYVSEGKRIVVR